MPAIKLVMIKNHINGSTRSNSKNGKEIPKKTTRIINKTTFLDTVSSFSILYCGRAFLEYALTFTKKKNTEKRKDSTMYKRIAITSLRAYSTKISEKATSRQLNRTHFLV